VLFTFKRKYKDKLTTLLREIEGVSSMKKNEKDFKLSYESDGKMDEKKDEGKKKDKSANFFNTTPDSE
jgi:hypothetical protein